MRQNVIYAFFAMSMMILGACSTQNGIPVEGVQAAQPGALDQGEVVANAPKTAVKSGDPEFPNQIGEPADSLKICPVTKPPLAAFIPPKPYRQDPPKGEFWYGTPELWTALPLHGVWSGLPLNPDGYTQKIFWWGQGYSARHEPEPHLAVTGRLLDASGEPLPGAQSLIVSRATNASAGDIGTAMLVGVDFPTAGCWEITGRYRKTEVRFVVWVEE